MDDPKKKCSFEDHKEIDATFYCLNCGINICNKCNIFHSKLLKNHQIISSDKNYDEIFTGFCKEKNHNKNDLSIFCKNHNQLCCYACTFRIQTEEVGKHKDCEICFIKDIKQEKFIKLNENLKYLEEYSANISKFVEELNHIHENIFKKREELKLHIQKIFTGLRNEINKREDELLLEVDNKYKNIVFNDEFFGQIEKLPKKIKLYLEKGKKIQEENDEKNLSNIINDCIEIENIAKYINEIDENIKKEKKLIDKNIEFNIDNENNIKEMIKTLGKITIENKSEINYNLYNEYNIKLKESIHKLNFHTGYVSCLILLNDGRFVSSSSDNSIIIFNEKTYQPDLIIKDHKDWVFCIIQLSSGELASCSGDKEIKIFKIEGIKYKILQTLKNHERSVYKIIELKNKDLVSCSTDSSILFFHKSNNQYINYYKITTNGSCYTAIQIKDNEICYSEDKNSTICFYDLKEKKIKSSISKISKKNTNRELLFMIKKNLLLIPGQNKISIVDINQYKIIRVIEVLGSDYICSVCMLNENMILTGDCSKMIKQWKIEGNNLILISKKQNSDDYSINSLINIDDNHIASASNSIKVW